MNKKKLFLAVHMHRQGREIEEPELKAALHQEAEFTPRVDDFLGHARQRGSVLEERDGAYRFIHLAFQEFLVARYLREVTGAESREAILAFLDDRLEDPWWREPILLLAGYMAGNAAKAARGFLGALAEAGVERVKRIINGTVPEYETNDTVTPTRAFYAARYPVTVAQFKAFVEGRDSGSATPMPCATRTADPCAM